MVLSLEDPELDQGDAQLPFDTTWWGGPSWLKPLTGWVLEWFRSDISNWCSFCVKWIICVSCLVFKVECQHVNCPWQWPWHEDNTCRDNAISDGAYSEQYLIMLYLQSKNIFQSGFNWIHLFEKFVSFSRCQRVFPCFCWDWGSNHIWFVSFSKYFSIWMFSILVVQFYQTEPSSPRSDSQRSAVSCEVAFINHQRFANIDILEVILNNLESFKFQVFQFVWNLEYHFQQFPQHLHPKLVAVWQKLSCWQSVARLAMDFRQRLGLERWMVLEKVDLVGAETPAVLLPCAKNKWILKPKNIHEIIIHV